MQWPQYLSKYGELPPPRQ